MCQKTLKVFNEKKKFSTGNKYLFGSIQVHSDQKSNQLS
jgi:hypothetical protein